MGERVYNFSAGPATMAEITLRETCEDLLDHRGTGIGVAELSHRSDEFKAIAAEAEADLRGLMVIPDNYAVIFQQGGATGQFAALPLNLAAERTDGADHVVNGVWGEKAVKEGRKFVDARVVAKPETYTTVPAQADWKLSKKAAYVHITPNETINGVVFAEIPEIDDKPLVADMSSLILSEQVDVEKFGVIYAGAQKNIGPAGLAVVIVRRDLLERSRRTAIPAIWDWQTQAEADSMVNTPPTLAIHMAGLVFKWLKGQGGVKGIAEVNRRKAEKLYTAIDDSELYVNPVEPEFRSRMNVPFILRKAGVDVEGIKELEKKFLKGAEQEGLCELGGHRTVGGMRASIYNAMPEEGVDKLIEFMSAFEAEHA